MPVIKKNLFPSEKIKNLKPGDLITMTVAEINEDTVILDSDTTSVNPIDKRVPKVKDEDARKMPLDKLEEALPSNHRDEE